MNELFKTLECFPAYRVSNLGRVQSRWEFGPRSKRQYRPEWRDLKPRSGRESPYLSVTLCDGKGIRKTFRVHQLVALCFLGEKPAKDMVVRHLDGDPTNNCAVNLAYGTYLENENDKHKHGTWHLRNSGAKLNPKDVRLIREKIKRGSKDCALAAEYGVSRETINRIRNNRIWRDV